MNADNAHAASPLLSQVATALPAKGACNNLHQQAMPSTSAIAGGRHACKSESAQTCTSLRKKALLVNERQARQQDTRSLSALSKLSLLSDPC